MRETIKLILALGLVTMISGGFLGFFYEYTMPLVEARQMAEMMEKGFKTVLPEAVSFQEVEKGQGEKPAGIEKIYEGFDEKGNSIGVAFEAMGKGFGGSMKLAVGLDVENQKIIGVKVLNHAETPGVGDKIEEEAFLGQFQGKSLADSFSVKEDVDGITGATISSAAVGTTVKKQSTQVLEYLGK